MSFLQPIVQLLKISAAVVIRILCGHIAPKGPEFSRRSVKDFPLSFNPKSIRVLVAGLIKVNCRFRIKLTLSFLGETLLSFP